MRHWKSVQADIRAQVCGQVECDVDVAYRPDDPESDIHLSIWTNEPSVTLDRTNAVALRDALNLALGL